MQWWIVKTGGREEVTVEGIVSVRVIVGDHVCRVRRNQNWDTEICFLPAGTGLACERRTSQQSPGIGPHTSYMVSRVSRALIETHPCDEASNIGANPDPDFDAGWIARIDCPWRRRWTPESTGARRDSRGERDRIHYGKQD